MTPLFPSPDHYLQNLITMTSPEAKRMWRQAIKDHWDCKCAYCHQQFEASQLTLDHVRPRLRGGPSLTSNLVPSCLECNKRKGTRHWLHWMRDTFGLHPHREQLIQSWISS